jgi:hypothetical protein
MAMTSQLLYSATLLPETALQRFQQQGQRAIVNGTTSTSATDGVATQSTQESVDQVQLSQAARQAFESAKLPVELAAASAPSSENTPDETSDQPIDSSVVASALDKTGDNAGSSSAPANSPIVAYQRQAAAAVSADVSDNSNTSVSGQNSTATSTTTVAGDALQLSAEEQQQLIELAQRDQEVKVHEAAHAAVGGRYTGAPKLSYATGPDGKRYAVAGEVNVDMSAVAGDPAATIKKAEIIRAAALAPAQPSAQDRNVAAKAAQMKLAAQAELLAETSADANRMVETSMAGSQQTSGDQPAVLKSRTEHFTGAIA